MAGWTHHTATGVQGATKGTGARGSSAHRSQHEKPTGPGSTRREV